MCTLIKKLVFKSIHPSIVIAVLALEVESVFLFFSILRLFVVPVIITIFAAVKTVT